MKARIRPSTFQQDRRIGVLRRFPAGPAAPAAADRFSAGPRDRRGASAVEFAMIAPLFFMLLLGMIEFGRALMVQQVLTNASREGARRAVVEDATADEVKQVVKDYLEKTSVSNATVTVDPPTLDTLGFGDPVTVGVTVSFDDVSWVPSPWFLSGTEMAASTVMRAERLQ